MGYFPSMYMHYIWSFLFPKWLTFWRPSMLCMCDRERENLREHIRSPVCHVNLDHSCQYNQFLIQKANAGNKQTQTFVWHHHWLYNNSKHKKVTEREGDFPSLPPSLLGGEIRAGLTVPISNIHDETMICNPLSFLFYIYPPITDFSRCEACPCVPRPPCNASHTVLLQTILLRL